jgi:hypothetical protein
MSCIGMQDVKWIKEMPDEVAGCKKGEYTGVSVSVRWRAGLPGRPSQSCYLRSHHQMIERLCDCGRGWTLLPAYEREHGDACC